MMKIHTLPMGPVQANCYVVIDEHSGEAAVIGAIMKLPGAPRALAVAQLKSRYLENLIGKMG